MLQLSIWYITCTHCGTGRREWGEVLGVDKHWPEDWLLRGPKRQQAGHALPGTGQGSSGPVLLHWGLCPERPGRRCYPCDRCMPFADFFVVVDINNKITSKVLRNAMWGLCFHVIVPFCFRRLVLIQAKATVLHTLTTLVFVAFDDIPSICC